MGKNPIRKRRDTPRSQFNRLDEGQLNSRPSDRKRPQSRQKEMEEKKKKKREKGESSLAVSSCEPAGLQRKKRKKN